MIDLRLGCCLDVLRTMPEASVDAVVTDPPYGLSFMGKAWDYDVPTVEVWREMFRVLKPGGHLLAFAGTRTQHRMAVNIEDAGFEIRDMIAWVYGSGFPKSLDVSKAIDKAAGAEREVVGERVLTGYGKANVTQGQQQRFTTTFPQTSDAPATDAAKQWSGWGTALKPALEPITVARKPLIGTVAENVLTHGTGAINVDGCRVPGPKPDTTRGASSKASSMVGTLGAQGRIVDDGAGRFPANLIHDGSDEVVGLFPQTTNGGANVAPTRKGGIRIDLMRSTGLSPASNAAYAGDSGSAARFFYCAKASKADRDEGCEGLEELACGLMEDDNYDIKTGSGNSRNTKRRNHHPTVKPTDLMRYLCRLVTPPGGIVLDPFMGSGSTGKAAVLEGFDFIGIEKEPEYIEIARNRISEGIEFCTAEDFAEIALSPPPEKDLQLSLLA